ncbi:glycosyltransferase family 2 protein [Leptolyngbya cf. ectocarpi LEGE 11479]|uniref:Glycosyltransferase family 2 protein n=1 Tax=Leptolyngbya cf. ectocarpi LEGE 11479 TaxID=1828722 RepID=A0A929FAG2_LEPEC|nr:glycosyltransferase [Leptolyngbya ectocarpi]MBE9068392.1 glycosyltransferase family 2 protein [Leptolyngbya cf. ectocarpi LEGE 11479]
MTAATRLTTSAAPALKPSITIVVAPRERFSYTQQSLESIYKYTNIPFDLVYIDAGSPKHIQNYLFRAAAKRRFTLLRTDNFLAPNQARNLGLSQVTTDYVVFIDNDIHVSPGWLEKLWQCAQETDAAVVCPLTCVGKPLHNHIHLAGGEVRIFMDAKGDQIRRRVYKKTFLANRSAAAIKHQLYRRACEFAELNCVLIKRDIFEHIGPLDEQLLSTQDDIDFCLSVNRAGGQMYCEPAAVVTHVSPVSYRWSDLAYFMLRWSDIWEVESLMHFQQKWDLDMDDYFLQRYKQLGYRRHRAFLYPLLRQLTGGRAVPWLETITMGLERWFNQVIADRHGQLPNNTVYRLTPTATRGVCQTSTPQKLQRLALKRRKIQHV